MDLAEGMMLERAEVTIERSDAIALGDVVVCSRRSGLLNKSFQRYVLLPPDAVLRSQPA